MDDMCRHYTAGVEAILAGMISTLTPHEQRALVQHLDQALSRRAIDDKADEVISGLLARVLRAARGKNC